MMASLYASGVYRPYISKHVVAAVELGRSGRWAERRPEDENRFVYLLHGYEVRMHQEAETLADAVVIVAGGLEIAETVHSVAATRPRDLYWLSRRAPLPDDETYHVGSRRDTADGDVVSYHHRRATLVYSPRVLRSWRQLDAIQDRALARLNALGRRLAADGYGAWVRRGAAAVADAVNDFEFL